MRTGSDLSSVKAANKVKFSRRNVIIKINIFKTYN